jgi:Domain of unknown function (DUF4286)
MIIYEVTTDVTQAGIAAYEAFMREAHIPAVLATGCFVSATIARSLPGRYRIRYRVRSMDVLDRYLTEHAPQLRADFAAHLGSTVTVSREVWSELQQWDGSAVSPP